MNYNNEKEIWVFISHSNKDFEKVRRIRNYLEEHSCRPLMFYLMCLSNDEEIDSLIKREIDCRTRFIICSSENARASKWVQSEFKYITSRPRTYDIVNLADSDELIKKQLDAFIKNVHIYFHFGREDSLFAREVYSHIKKYDLRVVDGFDEMDDLGGVHIDFAYHNQLENVRRISSDFGFMVFFASKSSLTSELVKKELGVFIDGKCSVFALLLDEYAKIHFTEFFHNLGLQYDSTAHLGGLPDRRSLVALDLHDSDNIVEDAVEGFVNRAFPCWDTYTMAQNFLRGIDGVRDEEEAERLFRIAYRRADELDSVGHPGGTLILAKCEANGFGTKKDLNAAITDFYSYLHGGFVPSPELEKEICQVEEQLNAEAGEIKYSHKHYSL